MIYTVTLNPAVDYVVNLDSLQVGEVNRARSDEKYPGGKGINVSRVLKRLNINSVATGFAGGFTGKYISDALAEEKINTDFVRVEGDTRINMKVQSQRETEINGPSPAITDTDQTLLLNKLNDLEAGDVLVLAGSVPKTLPPSIYRDIVNGLESKGILVYIDTSGDALKESLLASPHFIKPNHHELGELYDVEIKNEEDVYYYGQKLQEESSIQHVLISMGGQGAILLSDNEILRAKAPSGQPIHTVGSGDSMVAGFLTGMSNTDSLQKAFIKAVAAGSATAFSQGLCQAEDVQNLEKQIQVNVRRKSSL
ncbi:1-phosphofructokinase [Texcoconibacillus texcoconensis]|uniref:Tagatose-6-phosphate kinase n=1 Tax=Texcoconibacillus texcoconensis TaxID=1095777 RepID=A0A840QS97_9BACI|nr:1-phosphofructokinase [Texcoconibacillus texcoconensis]MBB5174234.1 1-phosphofructokinase [Texcoconibacillus texcoconensis]